MLKPFSKPRRGKHRSKAPKTVKPSFRTYTISKTFKRIEKERKVLREDLCWFAVLTNPKCERRAAEKLKEMGVEVFRPEFTEVIYQPRRRRRIDRKRHFFPRYVFVGLDPVRLGFEIVRSADGVERLVSISGCPIRIKVATLQWVSDVLTGHADHVEEIPEAGPFKKGDKVFVREGPFASFNAIVEETMRDDRVKALVSIFGRATPVEFEVSQLETLDAA